jgi:hypothetical protein
VRAFLGLHFRKFIHGCSNLVRPLNDLLRKGVKFAKDKCCADAFEGSTHALVHAPVLTLPDFAPLKRQSLRSGVMPLAMALVQC